METSGWFLIGSGQRFSRGQHLNGHFLSQSYLRLICFLKAAWPTLFFILHLFSECADTKQIFEKMGGMEANASWSRTYFANHLITTNAFYAGYKSLVMFAGYFFRIVTSPAKFIRNKSTSFPEKWSSAASPVPGIYLQTSGIEFREGPNQPCPQS